jgi:hypothetical protein
MFVSSPSISNFQIRAKTQQKKIQKNIGKLKSLNASSVKVEVRGNDKLKLANNKSKLDVTKMLLRIFVNSDDKGFVMNPLDHQLKLLELNSSNSKQQNREIMWKTLAQSSNHIDEWDKLFN